MGDEDYGRGRSEIRRVSPDAEMAKSILKMVDVRILKK